MRADEASGAMYMLVSASAKALAIRDELPLADRSTYETCGAASHRWMGVCGCAWTAAADRFPKSAVNSCSLMVLAKVWFLLYTCAMHPAQRFVSP